MCAINTAEWISLVSALATAGGVWVVWYQTGKISKQLKLQNFSDYTKRYQEIILHFPEDINSPQFVLAKREDYNITMRYMRAYFDICYEEWHLNSRSLMDDETWSVWQSGMKTAFSKPAFKQAWEIVRKDSQFGSEFENFVADFDHA
jgi:hypothetical protein